MIENMSEDNMEVGGEEESREDSKIIVTQIVRLETVWYNRIHRAPADLVRSASETTVKSGLKNTGRGGHLLFQPDRPPQT